MEGPSLLGRRCEVLAGPPPHEYQDCSLEEPEENSCEGVRWTRLLIGGIQSSAGKESAQWMAEGATSSSYRIL